MFVTSEGQPLSPLIFMEYDKKVFFSLLDQVKTNRLGQLHNHQGREVNLLERVLLEF